MEVKYYNLNYKDDYVSFSVDGNFINVPHFYMKDYAEINGILDKLSRHCTNAFVVHMNDWTNNIAVAVIGANGEIKLWDY